MCFMAYLRPPRMVWWDEPRAVLRGPSAGNGRFPASACLPACPPLRSAGALPAGALPTPSPGVWPETLVKGDGEEAIWGGISAQTREEIALR